MIDLGVCVSECVCQIEGIFKNTYLKCDLDIRLE